MLHYLEDELLYFFADMILVNMEWVYSYLFSFILQSVRFATNRGRDIYTWTSLLILEIDCLMYTNENMFTRRKFSLILSCFSFFSVTIHQLVHIWIYKEHTCSSTKQIYKYDENRKNLIMIFWKFERKGGWKTRGAEAAEGSWRRAEWLSW